MQMGSPFKLLIRNHFVISKSQQENIIFVKIVIVINQKKVELFSNFCRITRFLLVSHLFKKIVGAHIFTSPIAKFYLATALITSTDIMYLNFPRDR